MYNKKVMYILPRISFMIAVHSMHARPSLDLCIHAVDNKVVSFLNTIKRNMIAAWTCESLFLEYQFSFTLYFC